jgi:hypothetical protein
MSLLPHNCHSFRCVCLRVRLRLTIAGVSASDNSFHAIRALISAPGRPKLYSVAPVPIVVNQLRMNRLPCP